MEEKTNPHPRTNPLTKKSVLPLGGKGKWEENYAKNSIVQRRKFPLLWVISLCKFFFLVRRTCLAFPPPRQPSSFPFNLYRTLSTRKMIKYLRKSGSSRLFYIEGGEANSRGHWKSWDNISSFVRQIHSVVQKARKNLKWFK